MSENATPGFSIVGTTESMMPDGLLVFVRWELSGIPDGPWERDFVGQTKADFVDKWEVAPRGRGLPQRSPSINGSTIIWIVPKADHGRANRFVEQQLIFANEGLEHRKLELG